jgi:hypothetical protein
MLLKVCAKSSPFIRKFAGLHCVAKDAIIDFVNPAKAFIAAESDNTHVSECMSSLGRATWNRQIKMLGIGNAVPLHRWKWKSSNSPAEVLPR